MLPWQRMKWYIYIYYATMASVSCGYVYILYTHLIKTSIVKS